MNTPIKTDLSAESHGLRCALSPPSTSAAAGKYILRHDEKASKCACEELSARNSIDLFLQKNEKEEQLHSSTPVFLEAQVNTLVPSYRVLPAEPNTGPVTDMLKYVFLFSARYCECATLCGFQRCQRYFSSMADLEDYSENDLSLGPPWPLRSASRGCAPRMTLLFYHKWTSITNSDYRKADSKLVFMLKHPIFQTLLVLAITIWSYNGDVWPKEIPNWNSKKTDEGKARATELATTEIGKPSDFCYWIIWQLYFLALTMCPLCHLLWTEKRARISRPWVVAALASMFCILFVVLSAIAYPFTLFDPSELRSILTIMGLVSLCRVVTAFAVVLAVLYNHYQDIWLRPDSGPSLPVSIGRISSYAVPNKNSQ
jgi:hypothetical protein